MGGFVWIINIEFEGFIILDVHHFGEFDVSVYFMILVNEDLMVAWPDVSMAFSCTTHSSGVQWQPALLKVDCNPLATHGLDLISPAQQPFLEKWRSSFPMERLRVVTGD